MQQINIYIVSAKEDTKTSKEIQKHLKSLTIGNKVHNIWDEDTVIAGDNISQSIYKYLDNADIIILLISADFISTDSIYNEYYKIAMLKKNNENAVIIPIIVRDCYWINVIKLDEHILPLNGKSIKSNNTEDIDSIYREIVSYIDSKLEDIIKFKEKPKILFTGHTNAGKTTLIRTILRRPVGEVADRANVTIRKENIICDVGESKEVSNTDLKGNFFYQDMRAIICDCPGFQSALTLLKLLDKNVLYFDDEDLKYDIIAYDAVKGTDVVLYVADLTITPDDSYKGELKLIQKTNSNIIAILNKGGLLTDNLQLERRITQWTSMLSNLSVQYIIVYDAHFDKSSKLIKLYDNISKLLTREKSNYFESGIKKLKQRDTELRDKSIRFFLELLPNFIEKKIEINAISEPNPVAKKQKILDAHKEKLMNELNEKINDLYQKVLPLYLIASKNPLKSVNDIVKEAKKIGTKTDLTEFLGTNAATGIFVAIVGSVVGGLIGLIMGALPGALAGLYYGAGTGGGLGVILGSAITVGAVDIYEKKNDHIQLFVNNSLAIIWCVSNYGYGKSKDIEYLQDWSKYVSLIEKANYKIIDWKTTDFTVRYNYCVKMLDYLEENT